MPDFQWPWQYSFPPFFTLQPNLDTQNKQLEAWTNLVLEYCKHFKLYALDITEAQASPLFTNKSISRRLPPDAIQKILDELQRKGNIEWTDKTRRRCLIMWRTPDEWGKIIYKWAIDKGHKNSVCTLFEITNGDDSSGEEFHGIENWLLVKSLKTLEAHRKAELISFNGNEGVKFF